MSNRKFKSNPVSSKKVKESRGPNLRLRRFFSSLFNNNAAFVGGRDEKWWVAVILFVLSIVIAIVPVMTQVSRTKGEDFYKGRYTYNLDVSLQHFSDSLVEKNVDMVVVSNDTYGKSFSAPAFISHYTNLLTITDRVSTHQVPYFTFSQDRQVTVLEEGVTVTKNVPFEYLRVYYTGDIQTKFILNGNINTPADVFLANYLATLEGVEAKDNVTSHYIFGQSSIYHRLYNPNKINKGSDFTHSINGLVKMLDDNLNVKNFATRGVNGAVLNKTDPNYQEQYMENWERMINLAYEPIKTQLFWIQTGINSAIFVIISLMMGLIIFISTRGKHNPHSYLKFFESMKVGAWLLPTPALITLIVGFLLPQYFTLIFVMSLGMRSVWLTMRTLKPDQPSR